MHRTLSLTYDDLGALARTIATSRNASSIDVIGDAVSNIATPLTVSFVCVWFLFAAQEIARDVLCHVTCTRLITSHVISSVWLCVLFFY